MGPHLCCRHQWPNYNREFFCVPVVTSSCLALALSRDMIIPSVEAMLSTTLPPPWRVFQKDTSPAGQAGLCRGLTNQSLYIDMNRAPQTCSMSAEPKNSLRHTYLPAHM